MVFIDTRYIVCDIDSVSRTKLIKYNNIESCSDILEFFYHSLDSIAAAWIHQINPNNRPIILEVGCGYGEYTLALAEQNADSIHIGIDIKGDRIWQGYSKSKAMNIKNCHFIRSQIDHIDRIFAEQSVDEIWVTFPDPQPNNEKKRLVSTKYLAIYHTILKPYGKIILKTDSRLVYEFGKKTMNTNGFGITENIENIDNIQHPNPVVNSVRSRYEVQFRNKGHFISYIQAQKV